MKISRTKILKLSYLFIQMVTCVAAFIKQRQSRKRRFGVRPMNRQRNVERAYATLIRDMVRIEWDEEQFIKYTRMTVKQFKKLHNIVKPFLQRNLKKLHINSEHRLIMTLHYLSQGSFMQEIAWSYRVGKTTARNIIVETCAVLWNCLNESQLPVRSVAKFLEISEGFFNIWNIPNCIGAVDGKHVVIKAPNSNYRVSRARRTIESTFGILSQRWMILRRPIYASEEVVESIIQTVVVLHNFLRNDEASLASANRKYCPTGFADYIDIHGNLQPGTCRDLAQNLRPMSRLGSNNASFTAKDQRNALAEYFISLGGWVPWQEAHISRGALPMCMGFCSGLYFVAGSPLLTLK